MPSATIEIVIQGYNHVHKSQKKSLDYHHVGQVIMCKKISSAISLRT